MLLSFLWSALSRNYGILSIHVLCGLVQHVNLDLRIILVNKEQQLSRSKSIGKGRDQDFLIGYIDQQCLLIEPSDI